MGRLISNPKAVMVVAWLIIAKAALLAIHALLYLVPAVRDEVREALQAEKVSPALSLAWACFGAAIRLAAGIALLRRMAWGRMLYCSYIPAAYLLTLYLYGFKAKDLVGLAVFFVFVAILTRPSAADYFHRSSSAKSN